MATDVKDLPVKKYIVLHEGVSYLDHESFDPTKPTYRHEFRGREVEIREDQARNLLASGAITEDMDSREARAAAAGFPRGDHKASPPSEGTVLSSEVESVRRAGDVFAQPGGGAGPESTPGDLAQLSFDVIRTFAKALGIPADGDDVSKFGLIEQIVAKADAGELEEQRADRDAAQLGGREHRAGAKATVHEDKSGGSRGRGGSKGSSASGDEQQSSGS